MLDSTFVLATFPNKVWKDGKWSVTNSKGMELDLFVPDNYWFPQQVEAMEKARAYEMSPDFYTTWLKLIMENVGAMVWLDAERLHLSGVDKPKGKDFSKSEKVGAEAEQEYFKKVMNGA